MEESASNNPAAVASRGRGRGRPPKIAPSTDASATNPPPNPPKDPSPTPPEDADGGQNECRRSSRKKIIKFDVRDLLNKNRKAHKIQIEARIDSSPGPSSSGPAPSTSSVSRLFSMFESSHQTLPPPPPPPALEIFAKPRPTQSLIVAQVTSEPSANPGNTLANLPVVAARKRGRPRKSQPPLEVASSPATAAPSCSDSDTNSTSTSTSTGSCGDSGDPAGFVKRKPKSKLRVSLKRLNLVRRQESSDSGDMVMGNSPLSSSPEVEPPALQDENALDEQPENEQEVSRIVVAGDTSDSDSQIIFIEIETESPKAEEQEHEPQAEPEPLVIDIAKQGQNSDAEQDLDEIMVEVLSGPPSLWSADDEDEEDAAAAAAERATPPEGEVEAESSSPAPRRSRRSAQPRGSSRLGKTLEETFAEIAAESSKQILDAEESQDQEEQHMLIDLIEDSLSQPESLTTKFISPAQSPTIENMELEEVEVETKSMQETITTKQESVPAAALGTPETEPGSPKPAILIPESKKIAPNSAESIPKLKEKTEAIPEVKLATKAVPKPDPVAKAVPKLETVTKAVPKPESVTKGVTKSESITKDVPKAVEITGAKSATTIHVQPVKKLGNKLDSDIKRPTETVLPEKKPSKEIVEKPEKKDEPHPKPSENDMPESESAKKLKPVGAIPQAKRIPQTEADTKVAQKAFPEPVIQGEEIGELQSDQASLLTVAKTEVEVERTECPTEITALKTETASEKKAAAVSKSLPEIKERKEEPMKSVVTEKKVLKKSLTDITIKKEKETEKSLPVDDPKSSPLAAVKKEEESIELETYSKVSLKKDKESEKFPTESTLVKQKGVEKLSKAVDSEKEMETKKCLPEITLAKEKQKEIVKEKSPSECILLAKEELEKSITNTNQKDKQTAKCPPEVSFAEKNEPPKPLPESAPPEISKLPPDHATPHETAVEVPKEEQAGKKPLSDYSTPSCKSKDKFSPAFVECDAMFKAMDKANAKMRLEEKSKKKQKKVPPKVDSPIPIASSTPALGQKKSLGGKTGTRRNTIYEDSPKPERNSSPSSDSTHVPTPVGKMKRSKAKKKVNARRSTISEEAKDLRNSSPPTEELVAASSPVSSSSDCSSKRNQSKTASPELGGGSKLDLRRNTICEDRQADTATPVPLTKRRFSMHPKASANPLHDTLLRTSCKKRGRKAGKGSLSRQNSLDSSSSASQGPQKKKALKTAESLHAALMETESSESTSSGSKMRRWDVHTSPDLEPPNPLRDIAKFIEDGVNLLKRDYKVEEDQREEGQEDVKREPDTEEEEFAQRVANMETPATTPSPSPTQSNPEDSASTTNLLQDKSGGGGVRRSHRIKQKPQGQRASQGRGLASMAQAPISMDEQLAELANIEAINEQFLRSEGLNTFQPLRENYYRCARQVSQENAEMQCDCFLTGDEEAQGHLSCGAGCINRMLMIECGPLCTNGQRCTNKRFQQHQCWPCRVFRTEKKGCGITAELQMPPGEFIMEYVGEVIDSEEFERRQHLYSKDRKRHYYFMALRGEAIIDATSKGNISRYINHSCDPNAETQKWTVNGELRIGFFSVKPIQPGEEITFDYQYQRYGRDAQRCYCEAANCRGWIGGEPDSDEGEQLDADSDSEGEMEEEELEPEEEQGQHRKICAKAKPKCKLKVKLPLATKSKRKEQQTKPKDREYKAGRWLKPTAGGSSGSGEKASRKPKVSKFHAMLEDPDVLEELSLLSRSGLKNQLDTLRFSRCMVRAKLLQTRLQLLGVLSRGELPCRRLFLDYHGLRLLHAWISESGNDNQLRMALLDTLESLPIPNRTMLNDSRVYQSVQLWSNSLEQRQPAAGDGDQAQTQAALHKRMVALLQKWQALPEIFRIPKRERIEQMKEHEREADRQQKHVHASTALEDQRERESSGDRFRQDRFRRDTTSSRISKPIRMSGNNTICTITTQPKGNNGSMDGMARNDSRRRPDMGPSTEPRRTLSKELRRSLFERKVALDEAEKRVCSEDWREHELRCEFFGVDLNTDPKQLPFYQNADTREWFNSEDMPVPAPQRTKLLSHALLSPEMDGGQAASPIVEYKLPAGVDPLPPAWHWRMTSEGDIYYYNLRERISQWEPPSPEQRLQTLVDEDPTQQPLHELQIDPALLATELIQVDMDYVGSLSSKSLAQYVEAKVRERRELRRSRLVSIRVISPRRDEDRLYNQLESRKYKENKEKIRRRKELFRRRRIDVTATPASLANCSANPEDATTAGSSLPIQAYLYSSDEDASDAPAAADLPVVEGAVAQVEELDSLNLAPSTSHAALAALGKSAGQATQASGAASKRKLPMPPHVPVKKHRQEHRSKKGKSSQSLLTTTSGREAHEKFRFEISGHVADFLRPYRKDSCQLGRITSDEDYKFLIKRLSHHITTKEVRYCDLTGNPLSCTESVKHKSYDFINQYMRKKGRVYRKPAESTIF